MPRFFFDLKRNGDSATQDEEGLTLLDVAAAQIEAAKSLADFAKEVIGRTFIQDRLTVVVRDDSGPLLEAALTFQASRLH